MSQPALVLHVIISLLLLLGSLISRLSEVQRAGAPQRKSSEVLGHLRTFPDVQKARGHFDVPTWVGVQNVALNGSNEPIKKTS